MRSKATNALSALLCAQRSALPQGDEQAASNRRLAPKTVRTLLDPCCCILSALPPCQIALSAIIASRTPNEKPAVPHPAFRRLTPWPNDAGRFGASARAAALGRTNDKMHVAYYCPIFTAHNAKVSGVQHGATDRARMAKPCPSRRGVLNVRVSCRRTA